MHECPACGQACDCDGDDVWNDDVTDRECVHDCEDEDEEDDEDDWDWDTFDDY